VGCGRGELAHPCAARLPGTTRRLYHVHGEREAAGSGCQGREPAGSGSFFAGDRYDLPAREPAALSLPRSAVRPRLCLLHRREWPS